MNIQIIGSGYVGLPTAVGFNMLLANRGGVISVIDIDKDRIKNLQSKKSIFYEKKLNEELLKQNNIQFSCDFKNVKNRDIIFICVPTPNDKNNQIDLSYIKSVIDSIYKYLKNGVLLCIKSTVIPGSTLSIKKLLQKKNPKLKFHIACVPEFLKEGSALEDFLNPDRIICGVEDERSKELLTKLYNNSDKLFFTSINDAEMIKYASNSFLSLKVAFINELANLCEKSNCDINLVSLGMGLDKRIAPYFLNASIGYGGSCFPKDSTALNSFAKKKKVNLSILNASIKSNQNRVKLICKNILEFNVKNIAIFGCSFKANTDDIRYSQAILLIEELLKNNVKITLHDPKALNNAKKYFANKITYNEDFYECFKNQELAVFLVPWSDYKNANLDKIHSLMQKPNIYDTCNLFTKENLNKFYYKKMGGGYNQW